MLSIAQAIRNLTMLPAQNLSLKHREHPEFVVWSKALRKLFGTVQVCQLGATYLSAPLNHHQLVLAEKSTGYQDLKLI